MLRMVTGQHIHTHLQGSFTCNVDNHKLLALVLAEADLLVVLQRCKVIDAAWACGSPTCGKWKGCKVLQMHGYLQLGRWWQRCLAWRDNTEPKV